MPVEGSLKRKWIQTVETRWNDLGLFSLSLWLVYGLSLVYPLNQRWGLIPRSGADIWKVLTSPFLHANLSHLLQNTLGIFLFGSMVKAFFDKPLFVLIGTGILLDGVFIWLFGSNGIHIGASGIVYTFWGYLSLAGIFRPGLIRSFISAFCILGFSSMFVGLLPLAHGVSASAHFGGFLTGALVARLDRDKSS